MAKVELVERTFRDAPDGPDTAAPDGHAFVNRRFARVAIACAPAVRTLLLVVGRAESARRWFGRE
ncbi:MAG: hypothetical protein HY749_23275 [Gammaproteobacteria bacterium]|nr:hypothetical protein [Gammaproteobacteria bacterium]